MPKFSYKLRLRDDQDAPIIGVDLLQDGVPFPNGINIDPSGKDLDAVKKEVEAYIQNIVDDLAAQEKAAAIKKENVEKVTKLLAEVGDEEIEFVSSSPIVEESVLVEAPVEPAPVEPAPVEPAPVEPAPVEPAPVEPAPVEPAPVEAPVEEPVSP